MPPRPGYPSLDRPVTKVISQRSPRTPNDYRLLWLEASHRGARRTERRAASLSAEDQMRAIDGGCEPTQWHRAQTTWFFEKSPLSPASCRLSRLTRKSAYIFNSTMWRRARARAPRQRVLHAADCENAWRLSRPRRLRESSRCWRASRSCNSPRCLRLPGDRAAHHEQQHQESPHRCPPAFSAENPLPRLKYASDWRLRAAAFVGRSGRTAAASAHRFGGGWV